MTDIDPKDVTITYWPIHNASVGFGIRNPSGIRVKHSSGISIVCTAFRSQHRNRHKAMVGLRAMLEENEE